MSAEGVTPWFSADSKPARPGVYQRNFGFLASESPVFSYWDGRNWYWWGETPVAAQGNFLNGSFSMCQAGFGWRGLLDKDAK